MAKKNVPNFEIRTDAVHLGRALWDYRRHVPGLRHFYIDGQEVTEEQFKAAFKAYQAGKDADG